ncbi:MAG: polysaccharide biosynthesis/export family protein [Rhodothalassiaceae bacterium]
MIRLLRCAIKPAALVVLLCLVLSGCAGPSGGTLPPVPAGAYRLDAEDRVRVTVFGQPDLSGTYRIDSAGSVAMPLIGTVSARGLTEQQLEQALVTRFAQGFLREPQVSVEVAEYRPFYILGEVRQPGQYSYAPGMTVLSAIAVGGGYTYRARKDRVVIARRTAEGEILEAAVAPTTPIQPGDVITIRERVF